MVEGDLLASLFIFDDEGGVAVGVRLLEEDPGLFSDFSPEGFEGSFAVVRTAAGEVVGASVGAPRFFDEEEGMVFLEKSVEAEVGFFESLIEIW